MDDLWCTALQRFPEYPDWVLVKEKPGIYRMGGQDGKKLLCRITHGGLQVRVGGGWMSAISFLERHGPLHMAVRPPVEEVLASSRSAKDLAEHIETPASMERLLLPTKCWAQKIGIHTSPDIREQRQLNEDQPAKRVSVPVEVQAPTIVAAPQQQPVSMTMLQQMPRQAVLAPATTALPIGVGGQGMTNPITTTYMQSAPVSRSWGFANGSSGATAARFL